MERIVKANGLDTWCETFGDPSHPAVLLIMGLGAQGIGWSESFCQALADGGRHVIRYDSRDTGKSTCVDFAERPYTLTDLADDAAGLLDALGIQEAHIVGASMGGMTAQELALGHPQRVRTLTTIISTGAKNDPDNPLGWTGGLPPMSDELVAVFMEQAMSPPTNDEEETEAFLKLARFLVGPQADFDEAKVREMRALEKERATDFAATGNHQLAVAASRDRWELLPSIDSPTLVIYGTEDRMFGRPHAEALAKAIPGAKLLAIEGMGHDISHEDELVPAILEHTS